jgi:hypothetical protein
MLNRMFMKDIVAPMVVLAWVLSVSLPTHASSPSVEHGPHPLRDVEKRLREYLTKRVLVFRKSEIARHHITFDSRGRPTTESGPELRACSNGVLFRDLALDPERLVIFGEAVGIPLATPQPVVSRHSRELRLVTCAIMLDVPPDQITFTHAIGFLCRVFLTKEEFQRTTTGEGLSSK